MSSGKNQSIEKPWINPDLPLEDRVELLMAAMTAEEKIAQLWQIPGFHPERQELVRRGCVGSLLNVSREEIFELQQMAISDTRLGIPLVFGRDVIHGFRTIFPIPLGQAATFDESIVEEGASIAAKESASQGIHWTFAPMVDVSRDPRWGRIAESLGEDPVLASRLGAAMVRGFQGKDPASPQHIAACAKHYVGYGAAEGGRDYNTTLIPESELRNIYLRPFQACVDAGVLTVMSAFNDLNGIPASGHRRMIREILKEQMGFEGVVVSDWGSVVEMITHGYCADEREAAHKGLEAGVDMEMASESYQIHAGELVASGEMDFSVVEDSVRRILRLKFVLGLFENPLHVPEDACLLAPGHLEAARRAAVRSCVLLKNHDSFLPLASIIGKVALIGPLADAGEEQIGCWCPDALPGSSVTIRKALEKRLGERLAFVKGLADTRSMEASQFSEAVAAAEAADVAVLCLGEDQILSGEAHSRAYLDLPGGQMELLREVAATGTPVVLIILAGRPLVLTDVLPFCKSLLYAWHPGTMGGEAVAQLLFGEESPSGRLPVSFPAAVGQIPLYYNKRSTGRPAADNARGIPQGTPLDPVGFCSNYLDCDHVPLFPFGFGLSYSTVGYENLRIHAPEIVEGEELVVSVCVRNLGNRAVKELVQLYLRDVAASLTRPVRELKHWHHVELAPGESRDVEFLLGNKDLAFLNERGEMVLEPGKFQVWIGANSRCELTGSFELRTASSASSK